MGMDKTWSDVILELAEAKKEIANLKEQNELLKKQNALLKSKLDDLKELEKYEEEKAKRNQNLYLGW